MARLGRRAYAETCGPTAGDRVRLADTERISEVGKWAGRVFWTPEVFGGAVARRSLTFLREPARVLPMAQRNLLF